MAGWLPVFTLKEQHGTLVVVTDPDARNRENRRVGGARSFLPAVEGMRACAAVGVVVTHVAFQTGHTGGITGRLFGRFDLAVAVFFALSRAGRYRGHAAADHAIKGRPDGAKNTATARSNRRTAGP